MKKNVDVWEQCTEIILQYLTVNEYSQWVCC